jgi:carbon starvation protein
MSIIGFVLLMASIIYGGDIAASETWGPLFTFDGKQLTWLLIGYGFIASVLPVWLLLAPRDYLSTFLKIGTIVGLAIGIAIVAPNLQMPAFTKFIDGTGPVWSGSLFPFLFITIACGAVSGFHALISSGTTPKLLDNEKHARMIGYGGMLMESFVAMMALVAASVIEPGVLRDEQPGRGDRQDRRERRPGDLPVGLHRHPRDAAADRPGRGREDHHLPPAAPRPWPSAWPTSSPAPSAARR